MVIDAKIARHPKDRTRMTVLSEGREARTDAYVVARFGETELLRLQLHSGRTHQIRVHLAHIGHPVVGDAVYSAGGSRRIGGQGRLRAEAIERVTPRQALHAAYLAFRHPATGEPVAFRSEWPEDLRRALQTAAGTALVASAEVADPLSLRYLGFFEENG
jgi:23S rRNA pseudouridine1911/1915/1917 synthase